MKLQIEKWVEATNPFDNDTKEIFKEAVMCYKVSAYRAAFIMSYLTFQSAIKYRVLNFSMKPKDVEQKKWEVFRKDLQDETKWEQAVTNILLISPPQYNQGNKDPIVDKRIIKLKDHSQITDEYKSWRHKRNICAHGKSGRITASTVESFWNFIQDNIFKMYVDGGKDYWINSIFKSFRDRNENLDKSYENYIQAISYCNFDKNILKEIWKEIDWKISNLYIYDQSQLKSFWKYIAFNGNSNIQESAVDYFISEFEVFMKIYGLLPETLSLILSRDSGIAFKKEVLFDWIQKERYTSRLYFSNLTSFYWKLVLDIIENHTPKDDITGLLNDIPMQYLKFGLTDDQIYKLKMFKYFELKRMDLLNNLHYNYDDVPRQLEQINATLCVLNNIEYDVELVNRLNDFMQNLTKKHYPMTNQLYYRFKDFLSGDISNIIRKVAEENNLQLCF